MIYTLADGWVDLLIGIVVVGAWIIGAIASAAKKSKDTEAGEPSQKKRTDAARRLQELAERRRRQLEELARRREQGQSVEPIQETKRTVPPPMPSERAAERAAEQLRQQRQAQAERALHEKQAQLERRRREQAERAEMERQRRLAAQREAKSKRRRRRSTPPPIPAQTSAQRMAVHEGEAGHETTRVHRHVPDADAVPVITHHPKVMLTKMDRHALRQAIILKEVLDKPLAMREQAGHVPEF